MESRLTTMYSWRWASLPIHTIYMSPRIIYADNRHPNLPGCKVALIREGDCTHACTHVRGDPLLPKSCHNQSMDLASVQRRGFQGTGKQTVRVLPCYTVLTTESESACTRSCIRQHAAATTALRFIAPCLHLDIQCIGSHFFGTGSGLHGAGIGDGRRLAGARRRELHLACRTIGRKFI